MKFVRLTMLDGTKAEEMTKVHDKVWASPPPGIKMEALYACLGISFPGEPPNTIASISVVEAESAESLAAISYPLMHAGATIWNIPVMQIPVGAAEVPEEKYRG